MSIDEATALLISEIEREQRNVAAMVATMAARLISETESYLRGLHHG